jgi:hypothetical protein
MPGEYPTHEVVRPCLREDSKQADATARLYLCAGCRTQVVIGSCCDRGNIYCGQGCASAARCSAQREAGRRYQSSRRGRRKHAERARRYRERQKKVTHQGSPRPPIDDGISPGAAVAPRVVLRVPRAFAQQSSPWRCHLCGRPCSPFLRTGFLRRRRGADP